MAAYHGTWIELGHAIRHVAVYGGIGWLLDGRSEGSLDRLKPLSRFLVGATAAGLLAASSGVGLLTLAGQGTLQSLLPLVPAWSIGDIIGALILAPLLIPALRRLAGLKADPWKWMPTHELAVQIAVIALTVAAGFGLPQISKIAPQIWYVVILPPVAIALRSGFAGAATAVLVTNLLVPPTLQLFGSSATAFEVQVLLLIMSMAGLLMGAAISERDRALEATRASEQALEQRVTERTAEVRHALEANMHLLVSISHDLRQPVRALGMYLEALERKAVDGEAAQLIQSSSHVAHGLSDLLSKLLDLAHLEANIIEPRRRAIPLQGTFDRLAASFAPMAADKGLRFRVPGTGLWTVSDAVLLERILGNLVENAINNTSHGGVLIGCRRRGNTILIQVIDTGTGIAREERSLMFEQFRRGRGAKGNGLGLGLYIVTMTAKLLDHPIQVQSVVGRGTCFSVIAPRAEPGVPYQEPEVTGDAAASGGATVLLVIVDPQERGIFAGHLASAGYRVLTASSHGEALSLLASLELPPDVLVLDYRLPQGKYGTETLRLAREITGAPIPGVIVTEETGNGSIAGLQVEGVPFLQKPVSRKELLQAVAAADHAGELNVT